MKVLSVVGNRPQFIKSAPLSIALRDARIREVVLHTGQHYDPELSAVFFRELRLVEPRYRLDLRTADVETMRPAIAAAVERERPDWVLVYGDTNSTRAGAEAAGERLVAHVEAGLRSFDDSMPEEHNRIAVDRRADVLFCPDERSAAQLEREDVQGRREVVGDVMADAARLFGPIARARSQIVDRLALRPRDYVLMTIHRQANVDPQRLAPIMEAAAGLDRDVVFPAHPRARAVIDADRIVVGRRVRILEPLGYLDFTALVSQAAVVVTDSGGLQKEAYWHRVPCVTVRPSTEWVDTVELGANVLVEPGPDLAAAVRAARFPDGAPPLYGDGRAAERIAQVLKEPLVSLSSV